MIDKSIARGLANAFFRSTEGEDRFRASQRLLAPFSSAVSDVTDPRKSPRQRKAAARDAEKSLRARKPAGTRRLQGRDWTLVAFLTSADATVEVVEQGSGSLPKEYDYSDKASQRHLDANRGSFRERFASAAGIFLTTGSVPGVEFGTLRAVVGEHALMRWFMRSGEATQTAADAVLLASVVGDLVSRLPGSFGVPLARVVVPAPGGAFLGSAVLSPANQDRFHGAAEVSRASTEKDAPFDVLSIRLSTFFPTAWLDIDVLAAAERICALAMRLGPHPDLALSEEELAALREDVAIYGRSPRAAKFGSVEEDGEDAE